MAETDPKSPTREALEKMCPDRRTVRHFELLFEEVRDLRERLEAAEAVIAAEHP